jgi:filamentous hemagglutinin family protein
LRLIVFGHGAFNRNVDVTGSPWTFNTSFLPFHDSLKDDFGEEQMTFYTSSTRWAWPIARARQTGYAIWAWLLAGAQVFANPQGMAIVQGRVGATQNGAQLTVTASANSVIQWQSFNIGAGETTTFVQPSARSVVWNQISDVNPSQIWGNLNANGIVVLMNQNGFYMGPNSSINVGGFVASSAAVLPGPTSGGGMWNYQGPPPAAKIINYGQISARPGGSLFLISEGIENHGTLAAPDGTIGLYTGKEVMISERPDGRGLSANVRLPAGSIDNSGRIIADAGTIALNAKVVNQEGLIQANSVRNHQGTIELVATESLNLGAGSILRANGDPTSASDGGRITLDAEGAFNDQLGSKIDVRGGASGGNGGDVELCGKYMAGVESEIDGTAVANWTGGRLLLDPLNIILTANGGRTSPSGTISSTDSPATGTLRLNVNRAFAGFSQIALQATHDISLDTGTTWDLNASTGISAPGSLLTLEAGNNILFGDNSRIIAGPGWSLQLSAGADFSSPGHAVRAGIGGIYLNGGPANGSGSSPNNAGSIEAYDGYISLNAGHEVQVGGAYNFIRTTRGGSIAIVTGDGDVNAGLKTDTYDFNSDGYTVSALGLGGIGTAGGGNVTIHAGRDIISTSASIGAFGSDAGNVTLTAGRDIRGNFMVRNGVGTLNAARDIGDGGAPASFGLVSGGWNLHATRDVYLNEVFNPNGSLNPNRASYGPRVTFQFDYAPDSFLNVSGNSVQLVGSGIVQTADNPGRPPIYPPILDISAGAGGVVLGNEVVLYPSPLGGLNITTTDGGSLRSASGQFFQIVSSDSESPDYATFESGHANSPIHLGSPGHGVHLDISGDIQNVFLRSPEAADIHVHGDAVNFSFEGQNLASGDVSRVRVDGDVFDRSDRTSITLSDVPNMSIFTDPVLSANELLGSRLTYDAKSGKLWVQGILSDADLAFLLHPLVYVVDPQSLQREVDAQGNPILAPATFSSDTLGLHQLFTATKDIPTSGLAQKGLQVGGPGGFEVSAQNMDLGISQGIRSVGALNNSSLASVSLQGADIDLQLGGDLAMTSSQVSSFNGGNITVNSGGKINIGSQESFTSDDTPKGIYSGHGGSVSVHAVGDINVQGSRIATYDGGDVTVISDNGTVDAGAGARGFFYVTTSQINPATGQYETRNDRFFGSGIMATTRTDSEARMGDILVHAGKDILANSGGVLQLAFNHHDQGGAKVVLDAGGDIHAEHSGVLGANISLAAGGSIEGLVVASQNVNIQAQQNVSVTALAGGSASVSGQSISGNIVGGGNVNVSGSEISASVISTGGSTTTSGNTAGSSIGAFSGVAAPAAQKTAEEGEKTLASKSLAQDDDDEKQKRATGKGPSLLRRIGRVRVILPKT